MAPCKPAWSWRVSGLSHVITARPLVTMMAMLLLLQSITIQTAPVSQISWDPGFRVERDGDKVSVFFFRHYLNASYYDVKVTHLWDICGEKRINDSEVGKTIELNVIAEKCGTPMRVQVVALSADEKLLTDPVETKLSDPNADEATSTSTTSTTLVQGTPAHGNPNKISFTLIACVLVVVVLIAVVVVCLYVTKRCACWGRPSLPPIPAVEMHPVYVAGDTTAGVVESFLALLRAHGNVHVSPYTDSAEDIRSDPCRWVETRMKHPCIVFLSQHLSLTRLTDRGMDFYSVVEPALHALRQGRTDFFVINVCVEKKNQPNNATRAQSDRSAGKPRYQTALARERGAGVELKDFEVLVKKLHEGRDYPRTQMDNWQNCRITQDLLEQIRRLTEDGVSVVTSAETVSCECSTRGRRLNGDFSLEADTGIEEALLLSNTNV